MMEDDIFQEARRSNKKLIEYLLLRKHILKIIDYTVCEEEKAEELGLDPASLLRYSYVSCALRAQFCFVMPTNRQRIGHKPRAPLCLL